MSKCLTEAEMQRGIMAAAKQLGFLAFHAWSMQNSAAGFPDLVIAGHGKCFVYELKGPRGRVSDKQQEWIAELSAAGVTVRLVWPDDYDQVLEELAGVAFGNHRRVTA